MSEVIPPNTEEKKNNEPIPEDLEAIDSFPVNQPLITAIVLAAGLSRRMGKQNKLLLPIGKQKLIVKIVEAVLASQIQETLVVLGHEAIKLQRVLRGKNITLLKNSLYQLGMTTSIQRGIQAASKDTKGYMIVLGDLAEIEVSTLNLLIEAFNEALQKEETPIVIPTFEGKRGNPVIFSAHFREAILKHRDMNGCKGIVQENPEHVITVEMPNNQTLKDIDTPEDYKEWKTTVIDDEKEVEELKENSIEGETIGEGLDKVDEIVLSPEVKLKDE
ncbi:MAG: NTP transferase domain-containing protein [Chitinophagales bacterium]